MFERSQRFYDAVYAWKDYEGEAARLRDLIEAHRPGARTLLDVACGTGKHLELLLDHYQVEGVDLDPRMLAIARERLGDVPLHAGDMASFDLGRRFDVVTCLFSSIAYARSEDGLRRAVANLVRHVRPGGLVIVEPFFSPDQWTPGHLHAIFVDEDDLKLAPINLSPPLSNPMPMTFHYLVGTAQGVEHFSEDHVVGMYTREQHVEAFRTAGVEPEYDEEGLMGRGLYLALRPED